MSKIEIGFIEAIAIRILDNFGDELGAGAVAKAVNAVLLVCDVEKADKDGVVQAYQVSQNMMTNYGKNGQIDGVKRDSMAQVTFDKNVVLEFIVKFVDRAANGTKSNGSRGIDVKALAAQVKAELADEVNEAAQLEAAE